METRQNLQSQALETLRINRRLILNWGTGVGKSRVGVMAMYNILKSVPGSRFLLMVQENAHKDNWANEIRDALGDSRGRELMESITMDCYASLRKHQNSSWDMIVFDEGHHLRSHLRQRILATMNAGRVLVLTATISDQNDGEGMLQVLNDTFGKFESLTFGLQDAIDNNILSRPRIHLVPMVLDLENRDKYEDMTDYIERKAGEYFKLRNDFLMSPDEKDNEDTLAAKAKWLNAGSRRKRMLGHSKTTVARMILNGPLKNRRMICFSSSVDQIKWLGGKNHVSSNNTQKQNKEAIEAFNNGEQNTLFAMGMLQEGQNLKNIESGLIIQLDGKARAFIQKFGRVMRSKNPELYIIYAKDTHDEDYLDNALKDIDDEYIITDDPVFMDGSKAMTCALNPASAPLTRPEDAKTLIWMVDQNNGRYVSVDGDTSCSMKGYLLGIEDVEGRTPMYALNIQEEYSTTVNAVHVNKKLSVGLIASLASLRKPGAKPMMINVYKNGNWIQYDVLCGRSKAKWDKSVTDGYPKDNDKKIIYLDSIVKQINDRIINN